MVILTVFKQGKLVLLLTSDICKLCFSVQITFWDYKADHCKLQLELQQVV